MDIIKDRRTSLSFLYMATNPEIHYIDDRYSARGVSALMHGNWRGGRNEVHNTSSYKNGTGRSAEGNHLRFDRYTGVASRPGELSVSTNGRLCRSVPGNSANGKAVAKTPGRVYCCRTAHSELPRIPYSGFVVGRRCDDLRQASNGPQFSHRRFVKRVQCELRLGNPL